jgi:hypothetical protein
LLGRIIGKKLRRNLPKVLAGMIKIDNLDRSWGVAIAAW